jgi:hypothetical protein
MSLSLKVLLDHIADNLLFLSDALLFWFTLITSYDHAFHLSRLIGLSPHNYECLLVTISITMLFPSPLPPFLPLPLLVDCCLCPLPLLVPLLSLLPLLPLLPALLLLPLLSPLPPLLHCCCCTGIVLRRPLVLSSCQLVVASCFASVAGIFAMHPSFG